MHWYGMVLWLGETVHRAVWNGIVAGGRLYVQRYGMILRRGGVCI